MRQLLGYKIVTETWNHSLEEQLLELSREGYELWGGPLEEHYWPPDKDSSLSYRVSQAMVKWGPLACLPQRETTARMVRAPMEGNMAAESRLPALVTADWLSEHGACAEQVAVIRELFPNGAKVTMASLRKARAAGLDVKWLSLRLPNQLRAEYKRQVAALRAEYGRQVAALRAEYGRQVAALWAEYDRQVAPLLAEYDRQVAPLLAEYKRQVAALWAEYGRQVAALRAEYDRQVAALRAEYDRQVDPLWAEYGRQVAALWAEYDRQVDTALVKAWKEATK